MAEQRFCKAKVGGPTPLPGSSELKPTFYRRFFYYNALIYEIHFRISDFRTYIWKSDIQTS